MVKKVGNCKYCDDPIYDLDEIEVVNGKECHKGCYTIWQRGIDASLAVASQTQAELGRE